MSVARPALVLASTSPYRRELLARLRRAFTVVRPEVDETPLRGEPPGDVAPRLAREKACAVARRQPGALVIGADQVAVLDGTALSKPGTHESAVAQLRAMRGRSVVFVTAVAVAQGEPLRVRARTVPTTVSFRRFSDAALEAYLRADAPYDCAGAAKIESLGIALVERIESDDPTALIGLPLIAVVDLLDEFGLPVLPGA